MSAYADDTTIILDGSQQSLANCLNVFEMFYLRSGLKLNVTKTKAFWIGENAHEKTPIPVPYNIPTVANGTCQYTRCENI